MWHYILHFNFESFCYSDFNLLALGLKKLFHFECGKISWLYYLQWTYPMVVLDLNSFLNEVDSCQSLKALATLKCWHILSGEDIILQCCNGNCA